MAKKTTVSGEEPTGKAIKLISESAFRSHHKSATGLKTEIAELTGELGSLTKAAVNDKHLDGGAYRTAAGLAKKSPEKLASWLASFDRYRELLKLDETANLQGRLALDGAGEPADAEIDDDAVDLRPGFLRQPGASVASNPVQDLAAKAGAKTPGAEPIDKVGRGKPN